MSGTESQTVGGATHPRNWTRLRTAFVTGAAGGIGGAVAARLEADGLAVARTDRTGSGMTVLGDVTRPDEVARICDTAERAVGPIDVLIDAAGIFGERVPFLSSDPDRWWAVVETDLRGPALLCRRLVPGMVERGHGYVVNVNSRAAVWDDPGQSSVAYATAKAGLARFTAALAAEVRGTGVVVVDVSPGMVRTAMTAIRPDLDRIPPDRFLPLSAGADVVAAIVAGGHDDLHGHFVHALDDLDHLGRRVRDDPRIRTLSLFPHGDDDPLSP